MRAILFFVLIIAGVAYGQRSHVVRLNNGSEIRGSILQTDSSKTSIETKDGSVWVFSSNEIAGIDRFVPKVSGKGALLRAEFGILGGSQVSPSFLITNGYSFDEHWDLGLTIGYENLWWDPYMPIMLNGRYNLLNNLFTPYVDVMAGYHMPFSNWTSLKGGFSSGVRVGITKVLGNRFAFSTSLGYRFTYLKEVNTWWDDNITLRSINRFEIKFGFTFK